MTIHANQQGIPPSGRVDLWGTDDPPAPADVSAIPPVPEFTPVRRGYAPDEVDRYVLTLRALLVERREQPAPQWTEPPAPWQETAIDAGRVLMDAREAADRIRTDAERTAAKLVADAELETRAIVDRARGMAEEAGGVRRRELEDELAGAADDAARIRAATDRVSTEVRQWRRDALDSLVRLAASLEQWPSGVPDAASLEDLLSMPPPPDTPFDV
jgi:cell division septum initiation protein DivIVA